jgi:myosin heavy subunit
MFAEEFLLEDWGKYTYLSNGHLPVTGVDDSQEFKNLMESMMIMGFSPEDQSGQSQSIKQVL